MQLGLVIYATQLEKLSAFYTEVFDLAVIESEEFFYILSNGITEIVLLETEFSKQLDITEHRFATAIKPTFFIDTPLKEITSRVLKHGGHMFPAKKWEFGGRTVCDGCDPDGNIFQCRIAHD
jgi:predicted enzyme related to lactoylglutathione lyase